MGQSASPESQFSPTEQEFALLATGVRIIALRSLGEADAADDVVQETLQRTIRALAEGRLREHAALGGFVRSIARHVIADELRRRSHVVPLDPAADPPAADADPLDALVRAEQVEAVRAAMAHLSPGDRRVIQLAFVDGLTPAAIADRLREPRARVRKRKSRALERLRDALLRSRDGHDSCPPPTVALEGGAAPVVARDGGPQ